MTENEKMIRRLYEITSRHDKGFDHQVRDLLQLGCERFGYVAGDEALVTVSGTVAGMARATDYMARHGGEEFIVLLPDTDQQEALMTAERLRRAVNGISSLERKISSSFGISTFVPREPGAFDYDSLPKNLTDEAGQALYPAKNGGKNRVVHFTAG